MSTLPGSELALSLSVAQRRDFQSHLQAERVLDLLNSKTMTTFAEEQRLRAIVEILGSYERLAWHANARNEVGGHLHVGLPPSYYLRMIL